MPVKKRTAKARPHRITDEAVDLFRECQVLINAGVDRDVHGSPTDRFISASSALCKALGLKPWEMSPLDVHDGPSPYPNGTGGAVSWPQAQELRAELEEAAKR